MSVNILEKLKKNLGIPELKKVDPNTQEVKGGEHRLMQAVAPAAVAGIYDAARSESGLNFLAGDGTSADWLTLLFGDNAGAVMRNLEAYTGNSSDSVRTHFNSTASEAAKILRESATGNDRKKSIQLIAGAQRDWFLPYLPAELKIGTLLGDEVLDDRQNKMQGPVSSFMHKVEAVLTGKESKDSADKHRDAKM